MTERPTGLAIVVAALDALEDGDVRLAVETLLSALEDGPRDRRFRCGCGATFEWPGLMAAHVDWGGCPLGWEKAA